MTWNPGPLAPSEGLGNAPVWELAADATLGVAGVSSTIYFSEARGRTWSAGKGQPTGMSGISFLVSGDLVLAGVILPQPK